MTVRTWPLWAVPVGTGHGAKERHVRHVVAEVIDAGCVRTSCGHVLEALPRTWQPTRPCGRCPESAWRMAPDIEITIGEVHGLHERAGEYLDQAAERRLAHARHVIRTCGSKRLARKIARAIGFDPPESIAEHDPDLLQHVKYHRKDMQERYDK